MDRFISKLGLTLWQPNRCRWFDSEMCSDCFWQTDLLKHHDRFLPIRWVNTFYFECDLLLWCVRHLYFHIHRVRTAYYWNCMRHEISVTCSPECILKIWWLMSTSIGLAVKHLLIKSTWISNSILNFLPTFNQMSFDAMILSVTRVNSLDTSRISRRCTLNRFLMIPKKLITV